MIGEYQDVLVLVMLEEIEDAFLLEQPRHEIKGGFLVLNAIFSLLVGTGQCVAQIGDALLLQDLGDDVGRGLVLEDPVVGGAG